MAFGKNSRMDSRRSSSSSSCSAVTIVVFVALCLVGVWMMTSSAVFPVQNVDLPSSETNTEMKQVVVNGSRAYEDSSGDISDDATSGDIETDSNPTKEDQKYEESENEKAPDEVKRAAATVQQESSIKGSGDMENISEDVSKTENWSSGDGKDDSSNTNRDSKYDSSFTDREINGKEEANAFKTETQSNLQDKANVSETETQGDEEGKSNASSSEAQDNDEEMTDIPKPDIKNDREGKTGDESGGHSDAPEMGNETNTNVQTDGQANESDSENKSDSENNLNETGKDDNGQAENAEADQDQETKSEQNSDNTGSWKETEDGAPREIFPAVTQSEFLNETTTLNGAFSTQAVESKNENEAQAASVSTDDQSAGYAWKLCNATTGPDYIPCLDNIEAIKKLKSTKHYQHRERHCPEESPICLVPLPEGYKKPVRWPDSRNKIWYNNVPHTKLAVVKGHQNWVKLSGEFLTFPGGGTQFKHGALHYIDFIQESLHEIAWGKRSRVVLDVGCGVASFGGYLFDRDVITMSFAPNDEHEAQVQFALERGIPAFSAVMGTKRLPFPSKVFDVVHCARCRVPWHIEGGRLLLELNRVLRPGGYFVWSATPVYQRLEEDVKIWKAMSALTEAMCWELVTVKRDEVNQVGAAIYKKPSSNDCYDARGEKSPPLCASNDDPDAAWNVPLQVCMHRVPSNILERGAQWPELWPQRLEKTAYWLNDSQVGVYGHPAPEDFTTDYKHWKRVVNKSYLSGMGIRWSSVRNVMDMRAVYGGFASALKDMNLWVMNVVSIDAPDTLPIIYERGLFGIYHDWCESFSTYPRSYDLLHADHLFSKIKRRCTLLAVMAEVDRILRPEGQLIVRDRVEVISEIENMAKSLQWMIQLTYSKDKEGLLCVQKTYWRPQEITGASVAASAA